MQQRICFPRLILSPFQNPLFLSQLHTTKNMRRSINDDESEYCIVRSHILKSRVNKRILASIQSRRNWPRRLNRLKKIPYRPIFSHSLANEEGGTIFWNVGVFFQFRLGRTDCGILRIGGGRAICGSRAVFIYE